MQTLTADNPIDRADNAAGMSSQGSYQVMTTIAIAITGRRFFFHVRD